MNKLNTIRLFVLSLFIFYVSSICFGQNNINFICDKTVFVCYGNVAHIYSKIKNMILERYANKDPDIINAINYFKNSARQQPSFSKYAEMTNDDLIALVKNWDNEGFIVPKGLLKLSISSDLTFYLSFDSKIDTNFLFEKLVPKTTYKIQEKDGVLTTQFSDNIKIEKNSKGNIRITFSNNAIVIKPNGIKFSNLITDNISINNKSWNSLIKNISDPDCFMCAELNIKALYETLNNNLFFDSPQLNDLKVVLSNISRLRYLGKKSGCMLIAAINDDKIRNNYLKQFKQFLDNCNSSKNNPNNQIQSMTNSNSEDIIDKAPWIGIQIKTYPEFTTAAGVAAVTGIASTIYMNYCKAMKNKAEREFEDIKKRSEKNMKKTVIAPPIRYIPKNIIDTDVARGLKCIDNIKEADNAAITYNLNNFDINFEKITEDNAEKTFKLLVDKGFLKELPICPYSNKITYYSLKAPMGFIGFYCPVHGTPNKPNFKIADPEPNTPEWNKRVCFANCDTIMRRVSAHNFKAFDDKNVVKILSMKKGEEALQVANILLKEKLIKEIPLCPESGKFSYFSERDIENGGVIECEIHGTPFRKKTDFEISEYNKKSERDKCHFNLQWVNRFVERYNESSETPVDYIEKGEGEKVLRKVYGEYEIPLCPTTGKASYYTEGNLSQGCHVRCEIHGLPRKYDK